MDDFAHGQNNTPLPPGLTRFDWYTKVADILPGDWKLMGEWASEKATIRDILSHQSGLPRYVNGGAALCLRSNLSKSRPLHHAHRQQLRRSSQVAAPPPCI